MTEKSTGPLGAGEHLTAEQQRAVMAAGSVAVVAGAGTGKTKMLAHRYLHHLDQGLSPLEIVAVTFTEKAAAELRSRIRSLARTERPENRRALVELEAAQISTIHALAARICREHHERAGLPADFRVLDDLERSIWKSERLEEAIVRLPHEVHAHLSIDLLRQALSSLLENPVVAEEALMAGPEEWRRLLEVERAEAFAKVVAEPAWAESKAVLSTVSGAAGDPGELARRACLAAMTAFESRDAQAALDLVDGFRTNAGRKANWPGGGLEAMRGALKQVKALVKAACLDDGRVLLTWGAADDALEAALPSLRLAFERARDLLAATKRRERVLDFSDLEHHALIALEHPDVRAYYTARWRAVLVDEFQDTNAIQARILDHLEGGTTMTVVGDEKQAIYGFRGADVSVFNRYRQGIEERGGDLVTLSRSFRSHAGLVGALDAVFPSLLGDMHQSLSAVRQPREHGGPYVTLHAYSQAAGGNRATRMLAEAFEIASLIGDLVDSGYEVFDTGADAWRPVRFGDIAILARGRAPFDTYTQVLPAFGVPTVDTGGGNLLDTREAADGIAALRFFADTTDDVALVAILRSPFFAVDDKTLYLFAQTLEPSQPWWPALQQFTGERHLQRAADLLGSLLTRRWQLTPSRILQELDQATGYGAVIANLPGGRRRQADWRGFAALVRMLEAGQLDTFAVNRQIRRLRLAGVEVPRSTLQAGDAVSLMTIHKSKGLEWPVVVVADLSYEGGGKGPGEVAFEADCGVSVRFRDEDGEISEPFLHRLLHLRRLRREAEELRRLLYVAMTRARDRLLLTTADHTRGPMKVLLPALEAGGIESISFEAAADLAFPDAPLPGAGELGLRLEPALASFDATLGIEPTAPAYLQDDSEPAGAALVAGWDTVLEAVSEWDPGWLPVAEALRDAGLRAPASEGVFAELTVGGKPTGRTAAFVWSTASGRSVALVSASTPPADYDQETVTLTSPKACGAAAASLAALL